MLRFLFEDEILEKMCYGNKFGSAEYSHKIALVNYVNILALIKEAAADEKNGKIQEYDDDSMRKSFKNFFKHHSKKSTN
jgi:hypothetical protein